VPIELGFLTNRAEIAAAKGLERRLYSSADRVVVCSEGAAENLRQKGVAPEKLVLIPNLADVELFDATAPNTGYFESLGLNDKFVAVYTGAMGKANGLEHLVGAARSLRDAGNAGVAIVALGNGSERDWLVGEARSLPNLHVPPPIARAEVAGVIRAAGATMTLYAPYPALETGSPNKFFDSLAAGKPVVVNTGGWLRQLAEENEAGIYTPPGDYEALAAALVRLAEDPGLVERLGRNGRALAEREFDARLLAARFRETLEEVTASRVPATA
jgi:glycosyltransferase involved in cell wall biosynthesis